MNELSHIPGCRSFYQLLAFLVELYGAHRVSARLSGRAKGTTVRDRNHHSEQARGAERPLSSLRGLWSWIALRSRSRSSRFIGDCTRVTDEVSLHALEYRGTEHAGLLAGIQWREAIPSTAASGLQKTSGSGQAPSWRDLGVRCGPPNAEIFCSVQNLPFG